MTASTVTTLEIVSGIMHDEVLDLLQVGVGPAHQLAGLGPVVEREVQPLEVGEHPVAQVGLGPAGLAEGQVAAQAGEERRPRRPRTAMARDHSTAASLDVAGLDAVVDGAAHEAGRR